VLRLGAVINKLKHKGWEFRGDYGVGRDKKNYHYYPTRLPGRPQITLPPAFIPKIEVQTPEKQANLGI